MGVARVRRRWRWLLAAVAVVALGAGVWLAVQLGHPSLAPYRSLELPAAAPQPGALRVTFLGTSTLLLDDGETAILTDGYFSRPGVWRTRFGEVAPDPDAISAGLARARISRLAAVFTVHSHLDHAMDAPEVARRTGALLVGSESTANVGRGWGLPEERLQVVRGGETLRFGRFVLTVVRSRHSPGGVAMGEITRPLVPPVSAFDYREGGSFSLLVEHDGRRLLVQGSAGFEPGALAGRRAETVFLAVGGLGKQSAGFRADFWREVVRATGAARVILIHWDDFMEPLDEPLVPMPRILDDLEVTMAFLREQGARDGVTVHLPPVGVPIDPYAGR